ncbi:hypothetical protein J6590_105494 [Homalodisca vitripennis]|nr:hypothetical protein J6590_105494 [Homalodisca vitripennis]
MAYLLQTHCKLHLVNKIVKATAVLHNYLCSKGSFSPVLTPEVILEAYDKAWKPIPRYGAPNLYSTAVDAITAQNCATGLRMREATDVDRCFEKIALGAIPQIRLSTSVVSVRFCEVGVNYTI